MLARADLMNLRACSSELNSTILPLLWRSPVLPAYPSSPIEPFLKRYGHHVRHLSFPDPTDVDLASDPAANEKERCEQSAQSRVIALASDFLRPARLTDIERACVASCLPGLLSIDFSGITAFRIKDREAVAIFSSCPNLTSIVLSDCVDITNVALLALSSHPNLTAIHTLRLDRCCEITDAGLIPILMTTRSLRVFSMNLVPMATEAVVRVLAACCPMLEELGMSDNDCLTDEGLVKLAASCVGLTSLNLSECQNVSEAGLIRFAEVRKASQSSPLPICSLQLNGTLVATAKSLAGLLLPPRAPSSQSRPSPQGLRNLELADVSTLSPQLLLHIASLVPKTLQTLNLNQSVFAETIQIPPQPQLMASFSSLIRSQPSIRSLALSGSLSGLMNDDACLAIAESLPLLEILDVSDCPLITDLGVQAIAARCSSLQDVNLKGCINITDVGVGAFLEGRDIDNVPLRFLNVGLCNRITDASAKTLSRLCVSKANPHSVMGMHTLKFSGCFNISDEAINALESALCERSTDVAASCSLHLLCLSGCYKVSGKRLRSLLPSLPLLESINVYSCSSFDDHALTTLAECCPRLSSLVIAKCPVGDLGVTSVARVSKRLHTLYMGFLAPLRPTPGAVTMGPLSDVGVSAVLRGCRDLKLLDVSRCEMLTDAAFEGGGIYLEELCLQVFVAKVCPRITFEGLRRLLGLCPRLQSLEVTGCVRVSVGERERLRAMIG
ncbi:hypothetical protein HDU67_003250 [Dinochytrium kinnereticum]|nr:hypothetical protein HDU67_003250 [Dinochytrium kinnereticum]